MASELVVVRGRLFIARNTRLFLSASLGQQEQQEQEHIISPEVIDNNLQILTFCVGVLCGMQDLPGCAVVVRSPALLGFTIAETRLTRFWNVSKGISVTVPI